MPPRQRIQSLLAHFSPVQWRAAAGSRPWWIPVHNHHPTTFANLRKAVSLRCLEREVPVLHHSLAALRHGDLLFACEPLAVDTRALDAAIQAIGHKTLEWLHEHGVRIENDITAEHVGMVVADGRGQAASVVEAVRVCGVRVIPLPAFFDEFRTGTTFYHGQMRGVTRAQAKKAVSYATQKVGAPYAEEYGPPDADSSYPDADQAFYCSSLVDYAFRYALRKELVFTDELFPLIFEPPYFWDAFYAKQGKTVPSGHGSNPTLLLHSGVVEYSQLDFSDVEPDEYEEIMAS